MRITEVEAHRVQIPPAEPPFGWRRGLLGGPAGGEGAVLRLLTDDGVEGAALMPRRGSGVILEDLVDHVLRAELTGAEPLQREWLWHRMWEIDRTEELPLYILGLVDMALWDLAGPAAGRPGNSWARSARRSPRMRRRPRSPARRSSSTSRRSAWRSAIRRSSCTPGVTPAPKLRCAWRCASTSGTRWR